MTTISNPPKVYVGTYKKYNEGSLQGEWIDLSDFSSYDDFLAHCAEIHSDEEEPEFMFQDWENDPGSFISESGIDAELWEYLAEVAEMGADEAEAYADYKANDSSRNIEDFRDDYQGQYKDEEDFAYYEAGFIFDKLGDIIDECYNLEKMMGNLQYYFDYEKFARDLFLTDYWISGNGHVFRNS